ncbi:hypothetical protein D522_10087 [Mycobacterium avium subsp. paratuberculosis S5]|nr:hypothetical protein D522_10087 [Mycobacterium avium subsp. paratuberculosis S5]
MIGIAALAIGIVLGLVFHPSVPEVVQPYLPIAVVAALDAVFGGLRAYLERIFDPKVFVISFVFNVFVAALIVYVGDQLGVGTQLSTAIIVVLGIASSATPRRCAAGCSAHEVNMSQDPPDRPADPPDQGAAHGRHELPGKQPRPAIGPLRRTGLSGVLRGGRSRFGFGTLAVLLCLLLGIAIVTQVRQTESGDSLETARPADLLVLLDSLRQREGTLSAEVSELQNTLNSLQASGNNDQAAIQSAQSRLAALSILVGAVGATGPGVTVTIDDPAPGVSPEALLDVVNELRAAGAEALEVNDAHQSVRVGVDTWVAGTPGSLTIDSKTLSPSYSILAIGDPPTLAAAMNIPGGAQDTVKRVGGRMSVQQADRVDVTTLRQPKPHQYAQPVK